MGQVRKCMMEDREELFFLIIFPILHQYLLGLRTSEIHLFYNLQLFYWHFLEILWLFIFLVFYKLLISRKWKSCKNENEFQMTRKPEHK